MNVVLPKPLTETEDTVTVRKNDWEALIDQLEDIEDLAAVGAREQFEAQFGKDIVRRNYLTETEVRRLIDRESPVKIWREKRGMSQRELATKADVSASYLAEIETGRKPGSADALSRLARVLDVRMEYLANSESLSDQG
jgi:ribosome-binding protein aMBF1 (putative translation factor)